MSWLLDSLEPADSTIKIRPMNVNSTCFEVNILGVHEGIIAYESNNYTLHGFRPKLNAEWQEEIALRNIHSKQNHISVDVLSSPKLNGCSSIIIKSKTRSVIWMAHIPPDEINTPITYKKLLGDCLPNEELQVVAFNSINESLFLKNCSEKNYVFPTISISTYQVTLKLKILLL